jgi:epoxyqueuosine reductase
MLKNLGEVIDLFAKQHGCITGVCRAAPLPEREAPFISPDKEKRTNPGALLPGARSIVVLGLGYAPPVYSNLSTLGTNLDYHKNINFILKELAESLGVHRYKILADSPFLDECALAVRAGLGFYGRNGLVVSLELGSFFNIGCLLTDLELPFTESKNFNGCPDGCLLCLEACPVGLDKKRCISYLTQKKGDLNEEEKKLMGRQLYGCDICQTVCPFNKSAFSICTEVLHKLNNIFPPEEWLQSSDDALAEKYGHTAMWWRGPEVMRRNAGIAAGNMALPLKE